jgi:hypothetical protein
MGCFSSTRHRGRRSTFNEELAGLLAQDGGITVFGPPHAGIVTTATFFGQWRNFFSQNLEDDLTVRSIPIRFERIMPAKHRPSAKRKRRKSLKVHGSVVVTNDYALASALSSFAPDFSEPRRHDVDRTLME